MNVNDYASAMAATRTGPTVAGPNGSTPLADDADLFSLDLDGLAQRWSGPASRSSIGAEAMGGADRRAQMAGVPGVALMENAGIAVAAAAHALGRQAGTWGRGPVLVLCGAGNNGGDGYVAARHLADAGASVAVVLCSATARPGTADAARNWDRLRSLAGVTRLHAPSARELALVGRGVDVASVVGDALPGPGVRGSLREPIRSAVDLINR